MPPPLTEALRVWRSKRAKCVSKSSLAKQKRRKNSSAGRFFTPQVLRVWRSKRAARRQPGARKAAKANNSTQVIQSYPAFPTRADTLREIPGPLDFQTICRFNLA